MNLPIKKRQTTINKPTKNIKKANLGMDLEDTINQSNEFYLYNDIAVIHKKPTPIQIVKVDYPMRSKAVITEAYYKLPSTTDYNGVYKGYYIDFEAKDNHNKTLFPLRNIHPHQIEHLRNIQKHGGIGFLIVRWKVYNEYYILPLPILFKYWDNMESNRKSIPYDEFKNNCILIEEGYLPRLKYLDGVDKLLNNI